MGTLFVGRWNEAAKDGLIWKREDVANDGTHPSDPQGRVKVGKMLLAFFKSDPTTKPWFVKK